MTPSLEALPVELVSYIRTFLDLKGILSLRLASSTLASKLSPHLLAEFFVCKNVELTLAPLKNMAYMTGRGRAGSLLRDCTIVGVPGIDISCTPDSDEHVRLLTEAFINLKQYSPQRSLATLQLSVGMRKRYRESDDEISEQFARPSRKVTWETAQRTFDITMTALRESRLTIGSHLNLFGSLPDCSLVHKAFLPLDQRFVATGLFKSLETLTMSLSALYISQNQTRQGDVSNNSIQGVHGTMLLRSLLEMSSLMPNLKEFDIHWYNVGANTSTSFEDRAVNIAATDYPKSARLRACSLRGLYAPGSDLLEFLKAIRPGRLSLDDVHLVSETWAPIFDYLMSSTSPVAICRFDDIREGDRLVHFDVLGPSKFPYKGVIMGPSTLTKSQDNIKDAIHYRTTSRRPLGSGQRMRWLQSKILEYGPPRGSF
ncbi:hypothetical protein NUW58_g6696 [Xylaria curta]|uniref:Uncharacterized protein n=1 Tax=Xylaria curta TaxID=42375 RepID=A0ACC1NQ55_9PEZI|nr:hypothetical protein NUW58_g6696 [Xylaria curta]